MVTEKLNEALVVETEDARANDPSAGQLREFLREQLLATDSPVVKAIMKIVETETGLSAIQAADVVRFFGEGGPPTSGSSSLVESMEIKETMNLAEMRLMGDNLNFSRPTEILFPDGTSLVVEGWGDVTPAVVTWIGESSGLPELPFRGLKFSGRKWFLSLKPVHNDGAKMNFKMLRIGDRDIYLDTERGRPSAIKCMCALCEVTGVPATDISVRISLQSPEF